MISNAFTCTGPYAILILCGIKRTENRSAWPEPYEAWDEGYPYWWDLPNVVRLSEPIPCRGNVGMWSLPPSIAQSVLDQGAILIR